jgi:aspartate aminotransferase
MIAASNAIQSHATSNVNSITQKAVVVALNGPQTPVTLMLNEYRIRRDNLYGWLTADPRIKCVRPAGAFYMFPDIREAMAAGGFKTSTDFAQALLEDKRVAVTPGEAFDAPGFLRISYATSMENLKEGSRRLVEFVQARAGALAAAAR